MELFIDFELNILKLFSHISCPILDKLMIFVSATGNLGIIWIFFGTILLFFKNYRKCGICVLLSLLLCLIVGNITLKPLIARTRPFNIDKTISLLISAPTDFSFPSGHTLSSFASATASVYSKNKYIYIPAFIYAFLIAFSRLYLQVHFVTDVLAGVILGLILGFISIKTTEKKLC